MREADWQTKDGAARLYLGDCREVLAEIEPGSVDAVVTDPPYGIRYSHGGSSGVLANTTRFVGEKITGDDGQFDPSPWVGFRRVVLWGANHYASRLPDSSRWLVWDKRDGLASNDLADCEMAWTNHRGVARLTSLRWMGMIKDAEKGESRVHPMQKPVRVMAWCIEQVQIPESATILDPFMGSGTTGVAALRMGRKFIGIEIEPKYFEIAKRRIEEESRRFALLEGGA